MILYHGSNVEVKEPKLLPTKRLLDFGAGFYLTSDLEQAKKWAVRTTNSRGEGTPTVTVFKASEKELMSLKVKSFSAPDKDWLRFIAAHRTGKPIEDFFDVIVGPVANDQAIRTVNQYLRGYFPEEIAIQLLLPQKLKDQYTFKTERAINALCYLEVITL